MHVGGLLRATHVGRLRLYRVSATLCLNRTYELIDWPAIVSTHGPAVWRTICRIVGSCDAARDCYQGTFLAALQEANRRPIDNWPALLRTLATRRAIDCLRSRYRQRGRVNDGVDVDRIAQGDPRGSRGTAYPRGLGGEPGGLAAMQYEELRERVRELLGEMPVRQAHAFWLKRIEDMSTQQVAVELKTSPRNVSALVHRAAVKLRAALDEQVSEVQS